jgi:hypothetical protein
MKDGLSMIADERDSLWGDAEPFASGQSCITVNFSQTKIKLAEFASRNGMLLCDAQNLFAYGRGKFHRSVREKCRIEMWWGSGNACEGNVYTIGGSAGHEAENEHGRRRHAESLTEARQDFCQVACWHVI